MNKIANLTQHNATEEQVAAGVFDLVGEDRKMLVKLLTFATLPTKEELEERAKAIAMLVTRCLAAMIGGAPYLMPALERALKEEGVMPLYAFSERVSLEELLADGSIRKINVFKHVGW